MTVFGLTICRTRTIQSLRERIKVLSECNSFNRAARERLESREAARALYPKKGAK